MFCLTLGVESMAHAQLTEEEHQQLTYLFSLINERFKLQRDVAAYKYSANIPSFIPGREQQVLAEICNKSKEYHLDLQTVQTFVDIQMRAAVDLQIKWRNYWKRNNFPDDYQIRELNGYIRPELSRVTHQIVENIGRSVHITNNPKHFEEISSMFNQMIEDPFIGQAQRDAILYALVRIRKV